MLFSLLRILWSILKWVLLTYLIYFVVTTWLANATYLFNVDQIASVAKKLSDKNMKAEERFSGAIQELRKSTEADSRHKILLPAELEWALLHDSLGTKKFAPIYCSVNELIGFYGSVFNTGGYTGRVSGNITLAVMTGKIDFVDEEMQVKGSCFPGDVCPPPSTAADPSAAAAGGDKGHIENSPILYETEGETWVLLYQRGLTPIFVISGAANSLDALHDLSSALRLIKAYINCLLHNYSIFDWAASKLSNKYS